MTPQNDRPDLSFNLSGHLTLAKFGAYGGMGARRKLWGNWDNFSDRLANWPISWRKYIWGLRLSYNVRSIFWLGMVFIQIIFQPVGVVLYANLMSLERGDSQLSNDTKFAYKSTPTCWKKSTKNIMPRKLWKSIVNEPLLWWLSTNFTNFCL